jgi:hypothetical protein
MHSINCTPQASKYYQPPEYRNDTKTKDCSLIVSYYLSVSRIMNSNTNPAKLVVIYVNA